MVAGKNTTSHLAKAAAAPKLPPLPKLRVRKPDQTSANPCLGVMSSVLGMLLLKILCLLASERYGKRYIFLKKRTLTSHRLLGIFRSSSSRMRTTGKRAASMHGRKGEREQHGFSRKRRDPVLLTLDATETPRPQQEQDQPAPFPPISPDRWTAQEEVDGLCICFGIYA